MKKESEQTSGRKLDETLQQQERKFRSVVSNNIGQPWKYRYFKGQSERIFTELLLQFMQEIFIS